MQFGQGLCSLGGSKHGPCRGSAALVVVPLDGVKPTGVRSDRGGVRHTEIAPAAFL